MRRPVSRKNKMEAFIIIEAKHYKKETNKIEKTTLTESIRIMGA